MQVLIAQGEVVLRISTLDAREISSAVRVSVEMREYNLSGCILLRRCDADVVT